MQCKETPAAGLHESDRLIGRRKKEAMKMWMISRVPISLALCLRG